MAVYDIQPPLYESDNVVPAITCMWNHPELGMIPFTAVPNDVMPYGVEIYNQLLAGDYGTVLTYEQTHFYSTVDGNIWNGITCNTGDLMVSPTGTTPLDSTPDQPPLAGYGSDVYWYNDAWVTSYFSPTDYPVVADAQAYLKAQTHAVAAAAVNNQLRGYSQVQILTAPDVNALICFDYPTMTIGDYQTFIDGNVATNDALVDSAVDLEDLFSYNPDALDIVP